jgi:F420-dependent hydroxymycolic acid dehydrogenase
VARSRRTCLVSFVDVDVLLDGFGTQWPDIHEAAVVAGASGLAGIWLNDHLSGLVERAPHVLECWTILSALAATVPRVAIGPLVLNVANRDAGTLAVMAATLQGVSDGRVLLGIGAGGGPGTTYGLEQEALGRTVAKDPERRLAVERTVGTLRRMWSGEEQRAHGFLRPIPPPLILVAAFGPKMAELAGRIGDGVCVQAGPALPELTTIARVAHRRAGRDPDRLLVVASLGSVPEQTRPWADLGVDRLVVYVAPPFADGMRHLAHVVARDRTL